MLYKCLVVLGLASASAYQLPSMSRRELFTKVAAAAPLAAVAAPAFADANNVMYGYSNTIKNGAVSVPADYKGVAIGRPGALVTDAGAAIPDGTTHGTPRAVADFAGGAGDGKFKKTDAYAKAKARLMAQ